MKDEVELGAEIKRETHFFVLIQDVSLPFEQDGVFSKLLDAFQSKTQHFLPAGDILASVLYGI